MQRYIITVTGKVQGVFFRDTARRVATDLELTGFARNEPDGSVHIEIQGAEPALQQFLAWCRTGPANAKVVNLTHTIHDPAHYSGFQIYQIIL